jgi:hypothetical protein
MRVDGSEVTDGDLFLPLQLGCVFTKEGFQLVAEGAGQMLPHLSQSLGLNFPVCSRPHKIRPAITIQ